MNGYEFTRFEADYTAREKAKAYDIEAVAFRLAWDTGNLRLTEDYKDAEFWFYEATQSCSRAEATNWMKYFMANALAYGVQEKALDWRTKFLAAYDIYKELKRA